MDALSEPAGGKVGNEEIHGSGDVDIGVDVVRAIENAGLLEGSNAEAVGTAGAGSSACPSPPPDGVGILSKPAGDVDGREVDGPDNVDAGVDLTPCLA